MESRNFHRLVQYCLFAASKSDEYGLRFLGPIHLLKYAYLVDLDHALHNEGKTFTGVEWYFHNFGPWSASAFALIAPAMSEIGAETSSFRSQFDAAKDCIRWRWLDSEPAQREIDRELPVEIRHAASALVRRFGNDTAAILHFVYATPPMLNAAPGEKLDFVANPKLVPRQKSDEKPYLESLSKEERKERRKAMDALRKKFQADSNVRLPPAPLLFVSRLDTIYTEGVRWLDSMAGTAFPENGVKVVFSDEIWKSTARNGNV